MSRLLYYASLRSYPCFRKSFPECPISSSSCLHRSLQDTFPFCQGQPLIPHMLRETKPLTPDCRFMAFDSEAAQPVVNWRIVVPALDSVIIACREENVLLWVPLNELDILSVATGHCNDVKIKVVSHFSDPDGLITTATCQKLSIIIVSNTLHLILMTLQDLNTFKSFIALSPDASRPIKTCTGQELAGWMPWQISHCPFVTAAKSVL